MSQYLPYPGPPNSGIWEIGQEATDVNGDQWLCQGRGVAGQPSTWFLQVSAPNDAGAVVGGDLTGSLPNPTIAHVTGNNSTSSFIAANVPIAAGGQTIITSASIGAGVWVITASAAASVNAALATHPQDIAILPHGGAASVAYASSSLDASLAATEASGTCTAVVTLAALTQIDLVGYAGTGSPWAALAATSGGSHYSNATGITAVATV